MGFIEAEKRRLLVSEEFDPTRLGKAIVPDKA